MTIGYKCANCEAPERAGIPLSAVPSGVHEFRYAPSEHDKTTSLRACITLSCTTCKSSAPKCHLRSYHCITVEEGTIFFISIHSAIKRKRILIIQKKKTFRSPENRFQSKDDDSLHRRTQTCIYDRYFLFHNDNGVTLR